jgi:VWFA-related protein
MRARGLPTACAIAWLGLSVGVAAAETFEGATSVLVVEVPVRVVLDGRPIHGLTETDFEIWDGKERREITAFEALDSSGAVAVDARTAEETSPLPLAARRNFIFFLDFAYGGGGLVDTRRNLAASRVALRSLIETRLQPLDRAAIVYFSPLRGLKVLVDFTDHRGLLYRGLEALDLMIEAKPERLRTRFEGWEELAPDRSGGKARTPRGPIDASLDDLVAEARLTSHRGDPFLPHVQMIMHLTRGLSELVARSDVDGANHLVMISMGPLYGDNSARSRSMLRGLFRDLRRDSWSIHAVNTGGLGFGRESLFFMANETGGELFTNSRRVDLLLDEMITRTELTYLLAFQVENLPADGVFRPIRVELANGPPKARVLHRPGYVAPEPAGSRLDLSALASGR